ncbi:MAG: hypothetical protein ACI9HK_004670 [Pirellulaceae bacterium]
MDKEYSRKTTRAAADESTQGNRQASAVHQLQLAFVFCYLPNLRRASSFKPAYLNEKLEALDRLQEKISKWTCKPGFVLAEASDSHLSRTPIARRLKQPTRKS